MRDKLYLRGLFHRLRALIALNCSLIFVTDGSIPAIKLSTYRRRLNSGSEDGCFTSDSDVFLFGGRTVYRDICLGEGGYVVCYEIADIECTLGFGRNSLITLAIILGSDYSQGSSWAWSSEFRKAASSQDSACQIVKSVGKDVVLKRIASEGLSFAKKPKGLMKQGQVLKCNEMNTNGSEYNSQREYQFLQVIIAYLKAKMPLSGL